MTWKFTSGSYDGSRQTSTKQIRTFYDKYLLSHNVELRLCDLLWQDQMVIPVNLGIQLTAHCLYDADAERIFEQVMNKTEDSVLFLYIKEFWFMNIRRDIKVVLNNFQFNYDNAQMTEDQKREITVTFDFTCEACVYRPIKNADLITSIVTTLYPHINGISTETFGMSGNMYMNEKYSDKELYIEAARNHEFDGSLKKEYDFTKNGKVSIGPVSALASSYITDLTEEELLPYSAYSGAQGYIEHYTYSAVPDTIREYNSKYKLLESTKYVFANVPTQTISGGQIIETVTSGTCIDCQNNYITPYSTYQTNNFEYGHKYFTDSKQNNINTVYATSFKTEE